MKDFAEEYPTSRRGFLRASGSTAGMTWLATQWPLLIATAGAAQRARAEDGDFRNLSIDEAADFAAIAARIIPSDDSAGATEAGVVWFIDQALGTFFAERAGELRAGLAALNQDVAATAGVGRFALLAPEAQDRILGSCEQTPFFADVRFLTLAGMLALPQYGGNRNHTGWKLIGFEHRHVWLPPFGYYDAESSTGGDSRG
jgi:gluconate 2-dehydrogenase gamma chain